MKNILHISLYWSLLTKTTCFSSLQFFIVIAALLFIFFQWQLGHFCFSTQCFLHPTNSLFYKTCFLIVCTATLLAKVLNSSQISLAWALKGTGTHPPRRRWFFELCILMIIKLSFTKIGIIIILLLLLQAVNIFMDIVFLCFMCILMKR